VLQAGVSLFKNIPVAGAVISATDLLNNIIKEFDNDNANNWAIWLRVSPSLTNWIEPSLIWLLRLCSFSTGVCASSSAKS
jgi:hypothetical protein